jgi:hypothetical protein
MEGLRPLWNRSAFDSRRIYTLSFEQMNPLVELALLFNRKH